MDIIAIIDKYGPPPEIVERTVDEYEKTIIFTKRGEKVERWSGVTGGHSVRILRYNENDWSMMVHVDNSEGEIMPRQAVKDYIKRRISD